MSENSPRTIRVQSSANESKGFENEKLRNTENYKSEDYKSEKRGLYLGGQLSSRREKFS